MKVLMFGWEFPPHSSGGLGTACAGLTKGLANKGVDVTFVIPTSGLDISPSHVKLIVADRAKSKNGITVTFVDSLLSPYMTPSDYTKKVELIQLEKSIQGSGKVYGENLFQEVYRLSEKAKLIAISDDFDVIHCHDWMTYPAGIKAKQVTGKPLVVHIHATEFDRTGGNPNQVIYNMEREGFHAADKIIAVSQFTKDKVVSNYDVQPEKVEVVHNAVEFNDSGTCTDLGIKTMDKVVLFLGRLTMQKGPDHFLDAAKKVLDHDPNVKFVIAGSGDMEHSMVEKACHLGIADKVIFTGFLKGKDIDRAYRMADLYVMPSVSEPFGITPLEAMRNGTPVLISKQSGVSEVINHCLKVDFWDIDQMANKMLSVLNYEELHHELRDRGGSEVRKFSWDIPAMKCFGVYQQVLGF